VPNTLIRCSSINNVIEKFVKLKPVEDIIYGNVKTENGIITYPDKLRFSFLFSKTICHQAIFFKQNLFDKYGFYNEHLKFTADWEFLLKTLIIENHSYKHINFIICFYNSEGITSDPKFHQEILNERESTLKKLFSYQYDDYIELINLKYELRKYNSSRIIQGIRKFQNNKLYKYLKK